MHLCYFLKVVEYAINGWCLQDQIFSVIILMFYFKAYASMKQGKQKLCQHNNNFLSDFQIEIFQQCYIT